MGQKTKNIDDLFKDKLGSYAETPPPMAWDALEKRLDKVPPRGTVFTPGKTIYLVMFASLLLLSISVAKKLYFTSHVALTDQRTANKINTPAVLDNNNTRPITNTTNQQVAEKDVAQTPVNNPLKNQNQKAQSAKNITAPAKNNTHNKPLQVYKKMALVKHQKNIGNQAGESYASLPTKDKSLNENNTSDKVAGNQPENIYNSKEPGADNTPEQDATPDDKNKQKQEPDAPKKQSPDAKGNGNGSGNPLPKPNLKPHFARFEAGIKAGYESGFTSDAVNKLVVSPYIQYNLSPKMAIMVQPAVKSGTIQSRSIGSPKSYYKQNNDSLITPSLPTPAFTADGFQYDVYHYYYSQTHDSIVKSHSIGGNYQEYELPVLFKYNIGLGFSVYGGVNINYSKLISIKEQTNTIPHLLRKDSSQIVIEQQGFPVPPAQLATSQVITYSGTEISDYKNPYPPATGSMFRVGYMLGFSYEYNKRWLFDGLMQQTPTTTNVQGGYNINSALSSTYFRFTLGYKLIK